MWRSRQGWREFAPVVGRWAVKPPCNASALELSAPAYSVPAIKLLCQTGCLMFLPLLGNVRRNNSLLPPIPFVGSLKA